MRRSPEVRFAVDHHDLVHQAAPSARLMLHARGRLRLNLAWGDDYDYYDLASLTKVIFMTTALMQVADNMGMDRILEIPVCESLPEIPWRTTVADHLRHQAGCTWWKPYYKKLASIGDAKKRTEKLISLLARETRFQSGPRAPAIYSDFDFWILGLMLQRWREENNHESWKKIAAGLSGTRLHFNPLLVRSGSQRVQRFYPRKDYAPTERCRWRGRILQGEVHDENAWAMGGIAPHAGLFGRAEDVSQWGLELRKAFRGEKNAFCLRSVTVQRFFRRQMRPLLGDWGLGFMKPTRGSASCGPLFSAQSVGHTGFTGTSWWWDPQNDVMLTLLTNRIFPTRKNQAHIEMRRILHTDAFKLCQSQRWI